MGTPERTASDKADFKSELAAVVPHLRAFARTLAGEPAGAGLERTTEYLTQQTLSLDVGQMVMGKPGMYSVWGSYRWWKNKFGINPQQPGFTFPFTVESTWIAGATIAF